VRRAVVAQARTEIGLQLRRGENLLVMLAVPIGILVFFAEVDEVSTSFVEPVDFLVPGVLALGVMASAMVSLGIATAFERRYGVLKRLGSTPLRRSGLLAAKTATVVALQALQAVAVVATGAVLGWDVPLELVPAILLLLLGTVAFAGLGMLMAGTMRAEATLAVANGAFLALLLLGGIAYPLDDLPGALEAAARVLPAAALAETLRGALTTQAFPVGELAVLAGWAVAAPVAAARWFRWEE